MRDPRRRQRRRLMRRSATVWSAVLALSLPAAQARADDPPFVGWAAALPALTWEHQPSSADDCVAGRVSCVERTIRTMEKRYAPLAAQCAHSAVFALTYLRTTQAYLRTSQTPGFYQDPAFVNHEAVTFAEMYFEAYDEWAAGRRSQVPPAWRVALDAGAARRVSGSGNLLLGVNAHVNRDLPFALAKIGLVAPDGRSRKTDHDKVDVMLNGVVQPLLAEAAERYDPEIEMIQTPYGAGHAGLLQLLFAWRESAWRQAELLVRAPDEASRARVAAAIEANALANAKAIEATTGYVPPLSSSRQRDQHCATYAGSGP